MPAADRGRTLLAGRETAHRFAQRARAERRRRRRIALAVAAVLAVLAGGAAFLARSSVLRVESVVVSGARRQPVPEVLAAARVPAGEPMWTLDTESIRQRVATLPRLRSVSVSRQWPRTVRITVAERQPVAVAALPSGGHVVVDSGAAEIERLPAAPDGLLRVRLDAPGLADDAAARRPLVTSALAVAVALPPPVRARVESVTVASTEAVSLRLTGGAVVQWGSPARSERKAQVLTALLVTPYQLYDVRAPDTPAVR